MPAMLGSIARRPCSEHTPQSGAVETKGSKRSEVEGRLGASLEWIVLRLQFSMVIRQVIIQVQAGLLLHV